MTRVFVPGFGASPAFYRAAIGDRWDVHEPPSYRRAPTFEARVEFLVADLERSGPTVVGGHSMGAALAVAAAAIRPGLVERLLLIAPAGLPLTKPIRRSLADFAGQVVRGAYAPRELALAIGSLLTAPCQALRLGRAVRSLDLRRELDSVRAHAIRCDVVACAGDTLTPPAHCREVARLSGGTCRELAARGGHAWLFVDPGAFAVWS